MFWKRVIRMTEKRIRITHIKYKLEREWKLKSEWKKNWRQVCETLLLLCQKCSKAEEGLIYTHWRLVDAIYISDKCLAQLLDPIYYFITSTTTTTDTRVVMIWMECDGWEAWRKVHPTRKIRLIASSTHSHIHAHKVCVLSQELSKLYQQLQTILQNVCLPFF